MRRCQPARTKLPEPLWQAAVELARQHCIYAVAHPLRLDYIGQAVLVSPADLRPGEGRLY
jgi:hypothetical protein